MIVDLIQFDHLVVDRIESNEDNQFHGLERLQHGDEDWIRLVLMAGE